MAKKATLASKQAEEAKEEKEQKITYIDIDNLRFDSLNPRLPKSVAEGDYQEILKWMLNDAAVTDLMLSIGLNGFFDEEPLIVVERKNERGIYEVVEGNRRLAAVMLLRDPSLAPAKKNAVKAISEEAEYKPPELPAFIYGNREEVLNYLGYRHITGIQQWDSLAKAKYLEQLRHTLPKKQALKTQLAILAKTIGSTPDYVARLLTGLSMYNEIEANDFFDIDGLSEKSISFSLITTALQYKNLTQFFGMKSNIDPTAKANKDRLEEFTRWVFERSDQNRTRLGESRNLKLLNAVVDNRPALAAFRKGVSLFDAAMLTGVPSEVFQDAVRKAKSNLEVARDYGHKIEDPDPITIDWLQDIEKISNSLWKILRIKIQEKEETGKD